MDETTLQKHTHEIAIALIQKDIEYIKKSTEKTTQTLELMDKNFARRDELAGVLSTVKSLVDSMEKKANHDDMAKLINTKVDITDFAPIQSTLYRINWLLISTVIVGLLALLYKAGQ